MAEEVGRPGPRSGAILAWLSFAGLNELVGSPVLPSERRGALDTPESFGSRARALDAWDILGVLATSALVAVVATWGAVRGNPGYNWLPEALFALGAGSSLAVVGGSLALAGRESLDARRIPLRLARIWLDPPHDWIMVGVGFLLALPALALHTDVVGDTDSARVISSTMYVQRNGLGYLVDTQDNLLPHLTLGPLISLGGIPAATLFSVLSVQALAGTISFLAWKMTRSTAATFAAAVALLAFPVMWQRANLLPMYPLMLACGLLGLYFAQRATVSKGRERMWAAMLAGSFFVLSLEAHRIGQFFLAFSLLLLITSHWRPVAQGLARVYLVVVVLSIPRIVINLWEGGLDHFVSNRVDHWITEGHLALVHEEFFKTPSSGDLSSYVFHLRENLDSIFGWSGLVVLALGLVGLVLARGPVRRFAIACVAIFVAALLYQKVPYYERYFAPLMVASALGAGVAFDFLLRRSTALKAAAVCAFVAVVIGAGEGYADAVDMAKLRERSILRGPLPGLAGEIDDGRGVIGSRVTQLLFVDPQIKTYGGQFLSADEYATYLTWPSDPQVIDMLRRHDIGWVLITPRWRREIAYHNVWLEPAYGKTARQVESVAASPSFCQARRAKGYILYKLGPCLSAQ